MADEVPLLRTDNLCRVYPDGQVQALQNVSLRIEAGQFVAIMGPSGSGKSTLLNLLGGLDRPTSGEVYFRGQALGAMPSLDAYRARHVGFVFQAFHLLPTLTAAENVQIPMFETLSSSAQRRERAAQLLEIVGLAHRAGHLPSQLSVGERQRVAIARALANQPDLLLADEPTGNLDSQTAEQILDLFCRLHQEHRMTLVVVTHGLEVARRAQQIFHLRDGRLVNHTAP
ncbi:MAG: ABC transporter ATP-binding protein [Thermoguttaceae bacterium]|nr:ABC transporter ATP-binding protein [Thermoguttaceae bacterium]MDW8039278.1 ABC transporter ATP-binding protein [Thermoguttaceae bacterium]